MNPSLIVASESANPTTISSPKPGQREQLADRRSRAAARRGARRARSGRFSTKSSSTASPTIAKQKLIMKIAW